MEATGGYVESAEEPMEEEVPRILSPEFHDVFPIFASMLDLKSFMRLAMTSKDVYKRCMEDKSIRINVDEDELQTFNKYKTPVFRLNSFKIGESHIDSYVATLRKLQCQVNLRTVDFMENGMPDFSMVEAVHNYLKELGVKNIEDLIFQEKFSEWGEEIISFIKDFTIDGIYLMHIEAPVSLPFLRSLLQMDVQELSYECDDDEPLPVDILLESNSKIPKICLTPIRRITKEKFMELVSKVHSDSLGHVAIHIDAVKWNDYEKFPIDYEGPLPEKRPLLFVREDYWEENEYWFLHWQGDVTKCVTNSGQRALEIFKCDPRDCPCILRKDEDVLKDLTKKRPRVLCSSSHFHTFSSRFQMLPLSHDGPLPKERPLYCSVDENFFWLLDKHDNLMSCKWAKGCATWKSFSSWHGGRIGHPALTKYMFWKYLNKKKKTPEVYISCEDLSEFESWFKDSERFDFDYLGPLPTTRPVVFERTNSEERNRRVVLFKERVVQCIYENRYVNISSCEPWNLPAFMITAGSIKKILKKTLKKREHEEVDLSVDYEKFHAGFQEFKTSPCDSDNPEARPLVYEKKTMNSDGGMVDERWFSYDGAIRKATWKEGHFLLSVGDFREFPTEFMKELFRDFSKAKFHTDPLALELEQFQSCLEQYTVVPFEYSGPLTSDSPMAFVKNEIRHSCPNGPTRRPRCKCTDFFLRVWFLWDGMNVTYCFWGDLDMDEDPLRVWFRSTYHCDQMPPALTTIERLKFLIEGKYDETLYYDWFGSFEDLRACLNEFTTLPFDYEGPLPDQRPLLFETATADEEPCYLLLRADGSVIICTWSARGRNTFATFSFPFCEDDLPISLRSLPSPVFCIADNRGCRSV